MIETRNTTLKICLALSLVLSSSSCGGIDNALNPTGPQAQKLSGLWWLMFIVCSAVFVIVMIAVLLSLRNRTDDAGVPPQVEPPVGHLAVAELHHVVPAVIARPCEQVVLGRHGAAR